MAHEIEEKLYAVRNPYELQPWFFRHMEAMTAENLHSKGDIAMELAWRDKQIHNLNKIVNGLLTSLDVQQAKIDSLMLEYCPDEMIEEQLREWKMSQCGTCRKEKTEKLDV